LQAADLQRLTLMPGTYLFFAAVNACFFPIINIFYPETKDRSLEEIDIIFAKGFIEKMTYVNAAKQLPFLSNAEIDAKAREYGFASEEELGGHLHSLDKEKAETYSRSSSNGGKKDDGQIV
jgi:hypothetical protein